MIKPSKYFLILFIFFQTIASIGYTQINDSIWNGILNNEKDSRIFMLGESHFEDNTEHQFSLIKTLQKKRGLKKVIIESPVAYEYFYNEYLTKGDERIFKLMKLNERKYWKKRDDLIRKIKEFNDFLPRNEKLKILCLDTPVNQNSTYYCLKWLYQDIAEDKNLGIDTLVLSTKRRFRRYQMRGTIKWLLNDLRENEEGYHDAFKENTETYEKILKGYLIAFDLWFLHHDGNYEMKQHRARESYIYQNFKERWDKKGSVLFLYGKSHLSELSNDTIFYDHKFNYLARLLLDSIQTDPITIATFYHKSNYYNKRNSLHHWIETDVSNLISSNNRYTLVDLDTLPNETERFDYALIKKYK